MDGKMKAPRTNRKRGGRTPRNRPEVVSNRPAIMRDVETKQRQTLAIYLVMLLFFFTFGDLIPPGSSHGKLLSEHEWRLSTLCGFPFGLVIGGGYLLRSQPRLAALCLVAIALIGLSRWLTLDSSVSSVHLVMRLLVALPTCYSVYQKVFNQPAEA